MHMQRSGTPHKQHTTFLTLSLPSPTLAHRAQGRGLGRFLMQLLELTARRSGLPRLMLTVFHANESAVALYRRLGCVRARWGSGERSACLQVRRQGLLLCVCLGGVCAGRGCGLHP